MPNLRRFWSDCWKVGDLPSAADQNNELEKSHPRKQSASTCRSQQRSSADMSSSNLFTAGLHNTPAPSNTSNNYDLFTRFPFMNLPAELREQVYYWAAQPITPLDTGAIPGAPDRVSIPAIAQTSTQLRDEALHVLFKNRPAEIRMHSAYSFNRAIDWALKCSGHSNAFGMIKFCGRLEAAENQYFNITLELLDDSPFYLVHTKRCASTKADLITAQIEERLLKFLKEHAEVSANFRLPGDVIAGMILLIDEASRLSPPPEEA